MSECIYDYFVINHKIEKAYKFNKDIIKDGKSLYEVIRIIDGVPLFLNEHIDRLHNSAKQKNLLFDIEKSEIVNDIKKLIKYNKIFEGNIKLIFNNNSENVFIMYFISHYYPTEEEYKRGVKTIIFHGERKDPNIKVISNKFRESVNSKIKKANAYEAILVDNNDNITEGSRSNIFMIKGNALYTAPNEEVLPGITRGKIIECAKLLGIEVIEKNIKIQQINTLDALFISGTSPKILPINKVDDIKFDSSSNFLIKKLMKKFNDAILCDIDNIKNLYKFDNNNIFL
ncbi:branched-chain-amino-acid aminotransferase [Clostridium tepidiprofundi DSM 19306]|uniref:Branched-chain-amino-acid aminotransferase n=1 Tax=Clostridium tepidiprofundi DSM 19306 TaxID=1121338 RepID=A0A151B4U7_9CLOT|nr:aminotransferase class IV [Clostridium tepidiprofundi]KYH34782.1 branched-chain-amino-acid aminotransferase [Clostridium tepidiprofundi DSM 19306]